MHQDCDSLYLLIGRQEERKALIGKKLQQRRRRGQSLLREQYIRLKARDRNGRLLGGLRSFVFLYWLNIEVLFVEAEVRGSGLGSRLLAEAERQAVVSRYCRRGPSPVRGEEISKPVTQRLV